MKPYQIAEQVAVANPVGAVTAQVFLTTITITRTVKRALSDGLAMLIRSPKMISPQTGSIQISNETDIAPHVSPSDIDSSLIRERDNWDDREGCRWIVLSLLPFTHRERLIYSTLRFCQDLLFSASFAISDERFGTSWSDWSESKQLLLKSEHDQLLEEILGANRDFPWGAVWSTYDKKGGCSSFGVNYKNRNSKDETQ